MTHQVAPLDAYDDSFRCSCGNIFRSSAGFAICPEARVKGFVRRYSDRWFYNVRIDQAIAYRGDCDTWDEAFTRTYRHVIALRPKPEKPSWPNHSATYPT